MLPCIVGCSLKNSKSLFSKQPQASQASNHMVNNQVSMAWDLHELWCSTTFAQQHLWDNAKQGGPCCFCIDASKQNSKEPTSTLLQFLSIKRVRTQQSAPCAFDQTVSSNIALISGSPFWRSVNLRMKIKHAWQTRSHKKQQTWHGCGSFFQTCWRSLRLKKSCCLHKYK